MFAYMKKFTLTLVALLLAAVAVAQTKDLRVKDVFDGKVIPQSRMVTTFVSGETLEPYNLSLFHSVKMKVSPQEMTTIWDRINADITTHPVEAKDSEYGRENGLVSYLIARIDRVGKVNHYLCYQCYEVGGQYNITLVYIEGKASMTELKKTFKK